MAVQFDVGELSFNGEAFITEKLFQQLTYFGNSGAIVGVWSSQKDYESHNIAVHTQHFRDQLQPILGSPFDERFRTELILAP